ncbi:hypothetical protein ABNQ39_11560 [Azospirillum sp. A26]|uniref:hypothetical protein n=1 Tax=Azospirillum sp. A26 TaxID=3160607 RepID=UPI00366CD6DC
MKIEPENIPDPPERKPTLVENEKPPPIPVTSELPRIGLTFADAERAIENADPDRASDLACAIHKATPATYGDALVKLRLLSGELGLRGGYGYSLIESLDKIVDFMERHEP